MPDTQFCFQSSSYVPVVDNDATSEKDFKALGGLLTADGREPSYVGATHWAAILNNVHNLSSACFMADLVLQIKELKSDFGPGSSPSEEDDPVYGTQGTPHEDGIFSLISPPSIETILQLLPPRQTVDRRLSVYFKAKYAIIRMFCGALRLHAC
jgi:hypothetical protein